MKRIQNLQFQKRLFAIIALFFLVMFGMVTVGICTYAYHNSIIKTSSLQKETVESYVGKIEQYICDMDSISTQLVGNRTIQSIFLNAAESKSDGNYFENNLADRKQLEVECCSINIANNSVDAIYIYQQPYNFFSYNTERYSNSKVMQILPFGELDWNIDDTEPRQYYRVSNPHTDLWTEYNGEKVISFFRPLTATYFTKEKVAMIEVQNRYSRLVDICTDYTGSSDVKISIIDNESGHYIFPAEEVDMIKIAGMSASDINDGDVQIVKTESGKKVAVYKTNLKVCNWSVIGIQDYDTYMQSTKILMCLIAVLCVGFSVITLAGVFIVTRRLTQPVRDLRIALNDITLENVDITMETESNNEIDLLKDRFQQVLSALQKSARQISISQTAEYQAKIDALQAKINPHFLYNSLMTISAAGQERDAIKIQNMCSQLSDIFRYASDGGFDSTLEAEMDNVDNYLKFMKFRYLDDLHFTIDRCDELEKIQVPKLILQPIIENSFQHGFHMVEPPYDIRMVCVVSDGKWYVEITDNGGGFMEEDLERIASQKQKIDSLFAAREQGAEFDTQNMALLNVYTRLKIKYQDDVVFFVKNRQERGAIVRIGGKVSCTEGE